MGRILIGEQHAEVREVLESVVAGLGHEAVGVIGSESDVRGTDVVAAIVDPADPDGLRLARALRLACPDVPIVVASREGPSVQTRALEPDAHLIKPFPLDDLVAVLTDAVRRAPR